MQGYELMKEIEAEHKGKPQRVFIKWWRKEEDFVDFDLVERFKENFDYSNEIAGFELIDMEEMWQNLERLCQGRVTKAEKAGKAVVSWEPPEGAEAGRPGEYPYTPETLLQILDTETGGNFVD